MAAGGVPPLPPGALAQARDVLALEASMGFRDVFPAEFFPRQLPPAAAGLPVSRLFAPRSDGAPGVLEGALQAAGVPAEELRAFARYPSLPRVERRGLVGTVRCQLEEALGRQVALASGQGPGSGEGDGSGGGGWAPAGSGAGGGAGGSLEGTMFGSTSALGGQRTREWFAAREGRLTGSALGDAVGFWAGKRANLWEQKLGLAPPFRGNPATRWGTASEPRALSEYAAVTRASVGECAFRSYGTDDADGWLGASPDGLVECPGSEGPGLLEVKCPFNRGQPESARPWAEPPWYYMPQVQGLMEVFDREWCDVYCWTLNGSRVYRVARDEAYFAVLYDCLSEFWWQHVVPAKQALTRGDVAEAQRHRPLPRHRLADGLEADSRAMAAAAGASARTFPPVKGPGAASSAP